MSYNSRPVTYVTTVDKAQFDGYGVPSDSLGSLGDRYYDIGTGRWYLKRWVGNFTGADLVTFGSLGQTNGVEWKVIYKAKFTAVNTSRCVAGGDAEWRVGYYNQRTFLLSNGTQYSPGPLLSLNVWHSFIFNFTINGCYVSINGVDYGPFGTLPDINGDGWVKFGDFAGGGSFFVCSGVEIIRNDGISLLKAPLNDGEGITISNLSGNPGALVDGSPTTFWYQSWVSMD